jgi:hypothetical protein
LPDVPSIFQKIVCISVVFWSADSDRIFFLISRLAFEAFCWWEFVEIAKFVLMNTFCLTCEIFFGFWLFVMNVSIKTRCCWRRDLADFRGLTERERSGFLLVLEWFENFRLRSELESGREAAKLFWKHEVLREDRQRETWQLEQWGDAIKWYLKWLEACKDAGADHRSLAERVRAAVRSACSRRGLALRTKQLWGLGGAICGICQ